MERSHSNASYSSIRQTDQVSASNSIRSVNTFERSFDFGDFPELENVALNLSPQISASSSQDVSIPRWSLTPSPYTPSSEAPHSSTREEAIATIEDRRSLLNNEIPQSSFNSDVKVASSRSYSSLLERPPSYDQLSPTFGSKMRLRSLNTINSTNKETVWGIHWFMPSYMLICILAGLLTAVGHHVYNSKLNGHEVSDPTWPQRYGSAFSFFVKFCLYGALQIAYKQRAWLTVKRRDLQVKTLDGVFSACSNPLQFFNRELVVKATVPALLSLLFWLFPLCVVAAPASLTSITSVREYNMSCNNIQSIDFQRENGYAKDSIAGPRPALSFYQWKNSSDVNSSLYYDEPSTELTRVATLSLYSRTGPLSLDNPCGGAGNCSYSFSFYGPSYSCKEVSESEQDVVPIGRLVPNPHQDYIYYGVSDELESPATGAPTPVSPSNSSETIPWDGVFTREASLYIGWVENTTQPLPPDPTSNWTFLLKPHVMQCEMYNASYDYSIKFLNGLMQIENQTVDLIAPLLAENATMAPEDPGYGAFCAYHGMGYLFRQQLSGVIGQTTSKGINGVAHSDSQVSQTTLVESRSQFAVPNFPRAVEQGFQNTTFSLLSDDTLYSHTTISGPCSSTRVILIWRYAPFWLVLSYSLAVAATLIAAGIGAHAFRVNGYSVDTNFSTFLATTRNPSLDRVVAEHGLGACLGMEPLASGFKKGTRLRFGDVGVDGKGNEGSGHAAFGLVGETKEIVFGGSYI